MSKDSELVASQDVGSPLQLSSAMQMFRSEPEESTDLDAPQEDEGTEIPKPPQAAPPREPEDPSQSEEPSEEADFEEPEEPEEPSTDDEDPYADYSEAALAVEQLRRDGRLELEGETPKDLSWSDMLDLVNQDANARYEQAVRSFLESAGQTKEYIEFLLSGGSQETLNQVLSLEQLTQLDIEEEANRDQLITAMYRDKGMDDEENIQTLLDGLKIKEKDTAEAEKAKAYFQKRQQEIMQYERAQREQAERYQQEMLAREQAQIQEYVEQGDLGPIKLETPKAKREFLDSLFKPTERFQYEGRDVYITKYQRRMQELQADVKGRLILAKIILDGLDNLDSLKQQAKEQGNQEILNVLETRTTRTKAKPRKEQRPVWSKPLT